MVMFNSYLMTPRANEVLKIHHDFINFINVFMDSTDLPTNFLDGNFLVLFPFANTIAIHLLHVFARHSFHIFHALP